MHLPDTENANSPNRKTPLFWRPIRHLANRLSTSRFSLALIERALRVLHSIELTALWMLPDAHVDANASDVHDRPDRPLPWLLFLPVIVGLRIVVTIEAIIHIFFGRPPANIWRMVFRLQYWQLHLSSFRNESLQQQNQQQLHNQQQQRRIVNDDDGVFQRLLRLMNGWGSMDRLADVAEVEEIDETEASNLDSSRQEDQPLQLRSKSRSLDRSCSRHTDTLSDLMTKRYATDGETSDSSYRLPTDTEDTENTADDYVDDSDTSDYEPLSQSENAAQPTVSANFECLYNTIV